MLQRVCFKVSRFEVRWTPSRAPWFETVGCATVHMGQWLCLDMRTQRRSIYTKLLVTQKLCVINRTLIKWNPSHQNIVINRNTNRGRCFVFTSYLKLQKVKRTFVVLTTLVIWLPLYGLCCHCIVVWWCMVTDQQTNAPNCGYKWEWNERLYLLFRLLMGKLSILSVLR